jgi:hypothetical protein
MIGATTDAIGPGRRPEADAVAIATPHGKRTS